jgi:hypothetical protein
VLITSRQGNEIRDNYEIRLEREVKSMVEEKIRVCKQAGLEGQVSYKIQTGKPAKYSK